MKIHPNFKINGQSFTSNNTLKKYTETLRVSDAVYLQEVASFLSDWTNENDFIIVQTSGSTGKPKNITLQKQYMINSALATGEYFNVQEKTKALLCLSANYIAGKMMLVRAMILGWDLRLVPPNASPLKGITEAFDFCAMVPLQVENSITQLHQIKQVIIGGAPISTPLFLKIQQLKTKCFATYGMTETITHIAVRKMKSITDVNLEAIESYYQVLPNVKITQDDRSCLVIDAPKVSGTTIVTNDVVSLISETQFKWLGRFDNVINSGGVKLFPEQIEEKLSKIISNRFFISSIADEKLGQKLVLFIESEMKLNVDEKLLVKVLSKYEIPKVIYSIPKFIETPTGKVNRIEILKLV